MSSTMTEPNWQNSTVLSGDQVPKLELRETKAFASGITYSRYAPA